jgi:acyl carrier protein
MYLRRTRSVRGLHIKEKGKHMTNEEVLPVLAEIIEEIVGVDAAEVTPEKSFVGDLDIDSLSMVEIAVQAEDRFGMKIPDEQLTELKTVRDVVAYIGTARQEQAARGPR